MDTHRSNTCTLTHKYRLKLLILKTIRVFSNFLSFVEICVATINIMIVVTPCHYRVFEIFSICVKHTMREVKRRS